MKLIKDCGPNHRLPAARKYFNSCLRFKKQTVSFSFTYQPGFRGHGIGQNSGLESDKMSRLIKAACLIYNKIFSVLTDYLLGNENTTLDFNCIQQVSNTLPVTMLDFDGNTVIPPFNMRTGTDRKAT